MKSSPSAMPRIVLWPTMSAAFGPWPRDSRRARWSAIGHGDPPSWLTTTVVTPWLTRLGAARRRAPSLPASPAASRSSSACEWMSTNPGTTYRPSSSITRSPVAFDRSPTAAIRPPRIPMSARNHGFPVPSSTRPPRSTMSKLWFCAPSCADRGGELTIPRVTAHSSVRAARRFMIAPL